MDPRRRSRPAWARVTIHLNLWDVPAATAAATAALEAAPLHRGSTFRHGLLTGSADIPVGWCYLNPVERIAVVNQEVWENHIGQYAIHAFCKQIIHFSAPTFVRYDVESWILHDQLNLANLGIDASWWPDLNLTPNE